MSNKRNDSVKPGETWAVLNGGQWDIVTINKRGRFRWSSSHAPSSWGVDGFNERFPVKIFLGTEPGTFCDHDAKD